MANKALAEVRSIVMNASNELAKTDFVIGDGLTLLEASDIRRYTVEIQKRLHKLFNVLDDIQHRADYRNEGTWSGDWARTTDVE